MSSMPLRKDKQNSTSANINHLLPSNNRIHTRRCPGDDAARSDEEPAVPSTVRDGGRGQSRLCIKTLGFMGAYLPIMSPSATNSPTSTTTTFTTLSFTYYPRRIARMISRFSKAFVAIIIALVRLVPPLCRLELTRQASPRRVW